MFLANVTFGACTSDSQRADLEDLVEKYLASLMQNGQISLGYQFAWSRGKMTAYVWLARPDAFRERFHSQWGLQDLQVLRKRFGTEPKWGVLKDDVPKRFASWKSATFLYLFTHAFDVDSAVRHGDKGCPIPSYLLPLSELDRGAVFAWSHAYWHLDNVWLASGALEMPAYKQLCDPQSDLAKHGRKLCKTIERSTGIPTYYYLKRYWGRRHGEGQRKCPACGGSWRSKSAEEEGPFWDFTFRCKRCRLVSHEGDELEDERHARIGEYRARQA